MYIYIFTYKCHFFTLASTQIYLSSTLDSTVSALVGHHQDHTAETDNLILLQNLNQDLHIHIYEHIWWWAFSGCFWWWCKWCVRWDCSHERTLLTLASKTRSASVSSRSSIIIIILENSLLHFDLLIYIYIYMYKIC